MEEIPSTIFRYESLSLQSLMNFKRQVIYFASPRQFNDPYDCALTADFADPTISEVDEMRSYYANTPGIPLITRVEFESKTYDQLKELFLKSARKVLEDSTTRFLEERGVSCFCEQNDDLLMWSHYGDRCRGLCLEFSTDQVAFTKMRKVKYVDEMPRLSLREFIIEDNSAHIDSLFCTKSRNWQYEQEWRILHHKAGTSYGYDSSALKAVYFGPEIVDHTQDLICQILFCQNPNVELWRGHRSKAAFKVEFEKIEYTPFVVAKQMGLRN